MNSADDRQGRATTLRRATRGSRVRAAVATAALGALACGLALGGNSAATAATRKLPTIRHVWVIVLENEDESTTFNADPPSPYLGTTLPSLGALLPNYYGIGHNSLDNYIAMISGQAPTPDTQADCTTFVPVTPATPTSFGQVVGNGCVYPASVTTLANQLTKHHFTWKAYEQSMGSDPSRESARCGHPALGTADDTQAGTATDDYATRHDPFMYFSSVIGNRSYCDAHVVPLTGLAHDLAHTATTPNFSFITPNLCYDGHDATCPDASLPGGYAGINAFLSTWVPRIRRSPAFRKNGLLIVTFDEADATSDTTSCCNEPTGPNVTEPGGTGPGGGDVGAVLVSPFIKPRTTSTVDYDHYSMLRSIENMFGLPHLGEAAQPGLATFGFDVFK
jgi:hypothetical protein